MAGLIDRARFELLLKRASLLPLGFILLLAMFLMWQIVTLLHSIQAVDRTDQVISQAYATEKLILDRETGKRGYLLSVDREFLEPYQRAGRELPEKLDQLGNLLQEDLIQSGRVDRIEALHEEWTDISERQLVAARKINRPGASTGITGAKDLMDTLRAEFEGLIQYEQSLRDRRLQEAQFSARRSVVASLFAMIAGAAGLGLYTRRTLVSLGREYGEAFETVRRQSEEAKNREDWLQATLGSVAEGVLAVDAQGRVSFMNGRMESLTGRKFLNVRGLPVAEVVRLEEADGGEMRDIVGRALNGETIEHLDGQPMLVGKTAGLFVYDISSRQIERRTDLAALLDAEHAQIFSHLVDLLAPQKHCPDAFWFHPSGGNVLCYQDLAASLAGRFNLVGVQAAKGAAQNYFADFNAMVASYLAAIRQRQPQGPYYLGGWSMGGVIAYACAQALLQQGQSVAALWLLDCPAPLARAVPAEHGLLTWFLSDLLQQDALPPLKSLDHLAPHL
ncbi:hypothetical protein EON79_13205, partial [bacterium]